ncbi:MAG: NAD(P)H-hydrate dehydratase, partial [Bacteroidales bacterium]|nr:NAD(P)H-hydrate dehydratase [Bacteroidales bacterium]
GHGNNGGDGLALSRLLVKAGYRVSVHYYHSEKGRSPDAQTNFDRLQNLDGLSICKIQEKTDFPVIHRDEVVVDALLGSGLTREPSGLYALLIDHINNSGAEVVAVDIPSGLFGEDNRQNSTEHVIRAKYTLTFQRPKFSFFLKESYPFTGEWTVLPIGLSDDFMDSISSTWNYITPKDVRQWLPARTKYDHKGTFGHALLIAGSTGKMGAAAMTVRSALRSGAGLVTVHVPKTGYSILQIAAPEAMVSVDTDENLWTETPDLGTYTGVGCGPGIGTSKETTEAFIKLLQHTSQPLVLDADALNILSANAQLLLKVPKNSILTPHPGEYRRLFGEDPDDFSRVERLSRLAVTYGLVLVLKGAHTAIAGPDGSLWFNTTGNPGMATGGSGDVLTGMITALLARGLNSLHAACLGVYLHGIAGDLACDHYGMESMTAGDLINETGNAFKTIE